MRGYRRYLLVGVAIYLLTLLWRYPAEALYEQLEPQLAGANSRVTLHALSGRAVDGEAGELRVDGRSVGRLGWQLSPLSLLIGELAGDWQLNSPAGRLEGRVAASAGNTIHLSDIAGDISVAELLPLLSPLPTKVGGDLSLALTEVVIANGVPRADGTLVWRGAEVEWIERLPLGDLTFTLTPTDDGGTRIELGDGGGPLKVDGSITLTADRGYRSDLLLATRPTARPGLVEALSLLGRKEGSGGVRVEQKGRW